MAAGEIKPDMLLDTSEFMVFRDINPQAPVHLLVVPKRHIATLNDLRVEDSALLGEMLLTAQRVTQQAGITDAGYRLVMNCNADGGQTVFHLHMHLLGGRHMSWPPG